MFDFVPHTAYDTKAIIRHILFVANIFEQAEIPFLLEVSMRHAKIGF